MAACPWFNHLRKNHIIGVSIYNLEVGNSLVIWEWISEFSQGSELAWSLTCFHIMGFMNHITVYHLLWLLEISELCIVCLALLYFIPLFGSYWFVHEFIIFSNGMKNNYKNSFYHNYIKNHPYIFPLGFCSSFGFICYINMQKNTVDIFICFNSYISYWKI